MRIFGFSLAANQSPPAGSPPAGNQTSNPVATGGGGTAQAPVAPPPPASRLAYTRHATAGDGDDPIVNRGWYRFLVTMLWIGGTGVLLWIFFGGFQWGRATVPARSTVVVAPPLTTAAPTTPVQPVVIQPVVVQPPVPPALIVKVEVMPSPQPAQPVVVTLPPPRRELTDAERRNEALKERLRRRYGIE